MNETKITITKHQKMWIGGGLGILMLGGCIFFLSMYFIGSGAVKNVTQVNSCSTPIQETRMKQCLSDKTNQCCKHPAVLLELRQSMVNALKLKQDEKNLVLPKPRQLGQLKKLHDHKDWCRHTDKGDTKYKCRSRFVYVNTIIPKYEYTLVDDASVLAKIFGLD